MGIEVCYLSQYEMLQILALRVRSNPGWNQKSLPLCRQDVSAVFRYSGNEGYNRKCELVLGASRPAVHACV